MIKRIASKRETLDDRNENFCVDLSAHNEANRSMMEKNPGWMVYPNRANGKHFAIINISCEATTLSNPMRNVEAFKDCEFFCFELEDV